jgi:hypothetical protein
VAFTGKTREEIFAMFGNQPVPIAFLPEQYLQFFDGQLEIIEYIAARDTFSIML